MRALQQTLFLLLDFWLVLKWAFALLSKYPTKYPDILLAGVQFVCWNF